MPQLVYALCVFTSVMCAALLWRQYRREGGRLLFWSAGCFICLAVANVILCIDLLFTPQGPDLSIVRSAITLGGVLMLVGALIWESVT